LIASIAKYVNQDENIDNKKQDIDDIYNYLYYIFALIEFVSVNDIVVHTLINEMKNDNLQKMNKQQMIKYCNTLVEKIKYQQSLVFPAYSPLVDEESEEEELEGHSNFVPFNEEPGQSQQGRISTSPMGRHQGRISTSPMGRHQGRISTSPMGMKELNRALGTVDEDNSNNNNNNNTNNNRNNEVPHFTNKPPSGVRSVSSNVSRSRRRSKSRNSSRRRPAYSPIV